jgi:hypothetical protein
VKLALALLLPDGPDARLRGFAEGALADGASYLTLSTVPGYWFYPKLFEGVPGQGAFQSVWLTPQRLPSCPVCGAPEHRVDPLEVPLRAPRRAGLLADSPEAPGRGSSSGAASR